MKSFPHTFMIRIVLVVTITYIADSKCTYRHFSLAVCKAVFTRYGGSGKNFQSKMGSESYIEVCERGRKFYYTGCEEDVVPDAVCFIRDLSNFINKTCMLVENEPFLIKILSIVMLHKLLCLIHSCISHQFLVHLLENPTPLHM